MINEKAKDEEKAFDKSIDNKYDKSIDNKYDKPFVEKEKSMDNKMAEKEKFIKKRKRSRSVSGKKEERKNEGKVASPVNNNNQAHKAIDQQLILIFDNNQKIDPSKNRSFEEKGLIKITNEIIIPEHLLFAFTGKNSDLLKLIYSKTGAFVSVQVNNTLSN